MFVLLQKDVRSQDTVFVISGVTGSVEGRELTWKFVQDRWTDLHDRYKGGFLLARLIKVGLRFVLLVNDFTFCEII